MDEFTQFYKKAANYFKSNKIISVEKSAELYETKKLEPIEAKLKSEFLTKLQSGKVGASKLKKPLSIKTKSTIIAFTFFLLVVGAVLIYKFVFENKTDGETGPVAEVSIIDYEGDVQVKSESGDWTLLKADTKDLVKADSVKTGLKSKAVLEFNNGSLIRLNSATEVTITDFSQTQKTITLASGDIYVRKGPDESEILIKTTEAEYTTLGTAFRILNLTGKKGVEVYHNKVKLTLTSSDINKIITEGKSFYFEFLVDKALENKVNDINSSDILADEFILWNKEEDELTGRFDNEMGILGDVSAPELIITEPDDGTKTDQDKITISGTTTPDIKIYINNVKVENIGGEFTYEFKLNEGKNTITIEAVDEAGNKTTEVITVTKNPNTTPSIAPTTKPTTAPVVKSPTPKPPTNTPSPTTVVEPTSTPIPTTSIPVPTNTETP